MSTIKKFKKFLVTESENIDGFKTLLNKVLNDELSASILYQRISNEMVGAEFKEFKEEMAVHAKEELEHFNILLEIANSRNIAYSLALTNDAMYKISDNMDMVNFAQGLELQAMEDYKKLIEFSKYFLEFELEDKFRKILSDEAEHFDDVADIYGGHRNLTIQG